MAMKIDARQIEDVTILDLTGRLVLGEETALLRSTIRDLLTRGKKKILLNLAEVSHIDSSGLGELVSSFAAVRRAAGEAKLLNLTQRVHGVLKTVKLTTIYEFFNDEATALMSFNTQPQQGGDAMADAAFKRTTV